MAKLRPLGDRVLVFPLEKVEKTKGGIILPESAKEERQEGKVVAIGTGKWIDGKLVSLGVKQGDVVLFSKYGGDSIKFEGKEYKIVKEEDILGVIE
ncbi:MAG: co-chaperone GroES [bacterium]|nr:co-chaperone GroES [bacterium]